MKKLLNMSLAVSFGLLIYMAVFSKDIDPINLPPWDTIIPVISCTLLVIYTVYSSVEYKIKNEKIKKIGIRAIGTLISSLDISEDDEMELTFLVKSKDNET